MKSLITLLIIFTAANHLFAQITGPEQDCTGALKICEADSFDINVSYAGDGVIDDLGNNTCLSNRENNSVWYYFEIDSPGIVVFSINPYAGDDYDFAVFLMDSGRTCSNTADSSFHPVRCNYSSFAGPTGLMVHPPVGPDPAFLDELNVQSGEVYYLLIDNFNTGGAGYNLDFTGSTAGFVSGSSCNLLTSLSDFRKKEKIEIKIFPNPANFHLNITTALPENHPVEYQIINTLGEAVMTNRSNENTFSADVSALPSGVYFIHLQSGNDSAVKRFVRE